MSSHKPRHQGAGRGWTVDFLCSLSGRVVEDVGVACINFHPETEKTDFLEWLNKFIDLLVCWSAYAYKEKEVLL